MSRRRQPVTETLGCRLNEYESMAISELAANHGLGDAVIVNTCAVTAEAARKSRQLVRSSARKNPDARLVVTGCAAQIEPEEFSALEGVDAVVGNRVKLDPDTWRKLAELAPGGAAAQLLGGDLMSARQPSNHLISSFGRRARAHVQVQNGCDHRCTFCIIPYGRGNSRSVQAEEVTTQIRMLTDRGYNEVVLTGVDLTCWGLDLPGEPRLGDLVRQVLENVPELPRLRLSSIDVSEIDPGLLEILGSEERLMPHLHLSLQAGSNLVLKRMKRRHLREDAIRFCDQIRRRRPEMVFGADLIAGFPTESGAMFVQSLDLVRECDLTWLHVFPYSQRPGTPAARMPQVEPEAIRERAARLRQAGHMQVQRHLRNRVGSTGRVLMEAGRKGRTEQFAEVVLKDGPEPGSVCMVRFDGIEGQRLTGSMVTAGQAVGTDVMAGG